MMPINQITTQESSPTLWGEGSVDGVHGEFNDILDSIMLFAASVSDNPGEQSQAELEETPKGREILPQLPESEQPPVILHNNPDLPKPIDHSGEGVSADAPERAPKMPTLPLELERLNPEKYNHMRGERNHTAPFERITVQDMTPTRRVDNPDTPTVDTPPYIDRPPVDTPPIILPPKMTAKDPVKLDQGTEPKPKPQSTVEAVDPADIPDLKHLDKPLGETPKAEKLPVIRAQEKAPNTQQSEQAIKEAVIREAAYKESANKLSRPVNQLSPDSDPVEVQEVTKSENIRTNTILEKAGELVDSKRIIVDERIAAKPRQQSTNPEPAISIPKGVRTHPPESLNAAAENRVTVRNETVSEKPVNTSVSEAPAGDLAEDATPIQKPKTDLASDLKNMAETTAKTETEQSNRQAKVMTGAVGDEFDAEATGVTMNVDAKKEVDSKFGKDFRGERKIESVGEKILEKFSADIDVEVETPIRKTEAPSPAKQLASRLIETAETLFENGEPKTMKIKLNPEELGTVELSVSKNAKGSLDIVIEVESEMASKLISDGIDLLKSTLLDSGSDVSSLEITDLSSREKQQEKDDQAKLDKEFGNENPEQEEESTQDEPVEGRIISYSA